MVKFGPSDAPSPPPDPPNHSKRAQPLQANIEAKRSFYSGQSYLGQSSSRPGRPDTVLFRPACLGAKPLQATTPCLGQTSRGKVSLCGGRARRGLQRAPRVGRAQNFALFSFPLPQQFHSFLASLGGGVLKRRDPQMCTFEILGLSSNFHPEFKVYVSA